MSVIRCPPDIENYHIFLKGQYENTFINMSAGYPTATKIENISDKRTTLMEYWMPKFVFKFQLYKLYGEKPQGGQCRIRRFFATLRMTMKMSGILKENRTLWNGLSNAMRQSAAISDCATGERFNLITKSVISQLGSYNFTLTIKQLDWTHNLVLIPKGISDYELGQALPKDFRGSLPTIEEPAEHLQFAISISGYR